MADLLSVGIDIGTTTTQLIFSKIKMENTTGYFAVPRISIVDKEILYQSEVHLTPLLTAQPPMLQLMLLMTLHPVRPLRSVSLPRCPALTQLTDCR